MAKYRVTLTDEERKILKDTISKGKSAKRMRNALLLLNVDRSEKLDKQNDTVISETLQVSTKTVERIKKTFVEEGFEIALNGAPPQPRVPKKIDGDVEAHVIALSCSEVPSESTSWTLRLLAEKMVELEYIDSISHESVRKVLKKTNLSRGKKSVG